MEVGPFGSPPLTTGHGRVATGAAMRPDGLHTLYSQGTIRGPPYTGRGKRRHTLWGYFSRDGR